MPDAIDLIRELWEHERPDLDTEPVAVLGRVQRLARLIDRELKAFDTRHSLEAGEFDVLTTLRRSGAPYQMSAGAFIKASMVTSGAITRRIDRMEAKGLVERVRVPGGDRRAVLIRLTDKGIELVDDLFAKHLDNEARLVAPLTAEEITQLSDLLRRLLESLGDTTLT
ncbi:MarR family winged helix-turn-helix transcriptional regulator [Lentzea sp. NPDC055074]